MFCVICQTDNIKPSYYECLKCHQASCKRCLEKYWKYYIKNQTDYTAQIYLQAIAQKKNRHHCPHCNNIAQFKFVPSWFYQILHDFFSIPMPPTVKKS